MVSPIKNRALRFLNLVIRRNSFITRLIFGVRIPDSTRIAWDFTTITLKNCLLRYVTDYSRVLEIGTGSYAILPLFLARHRNCEITATDLHDEYVDLSRQTALLNGAELNLIRSDLFGSINGSFDIIFWNSVYIPRNTGTSLGINQFSTVDSDWCGGETGLEEINRFLRDSSDHLSPGGKILLGFNPVYLAKERVEEACRRNGWSVCTTHRTPLNPSRVFVLEKPE
jgi:methylase of polypeptide subunit release factors